MDPLYAVIYDLSGGASLNQEFVEASAGFGDSITFGVSRYIRQVDSGAEIVDTASIEYQAGGWAGVVASGGITKVGFNLFKKGYHRYQSGRNWQTNSHTRRQTQQRRLAQGRSQMANGVGIIVIEISGAMVKSEIQGAAADAAAENTEGACSCE